MYYDDHNPPHFHAEYAGHHALFDIQEGCVMRGSLPACQLKLVLAWAELHKDELMQNWELAVDGRELDQIDPLAKGASMNDYIPTVVQALPGPDFTVYAYFSDGTIRLADVKPLIDKGGVFSKIADEDRFASLLTVMGGVVAWDVAGNRDATRCIDLDPCAMYEKSLVVADPLAEVA